MELTNEFRVGVPVHEAWTLLTDVERIAPCMPGAELQEIEGEEYRGIVKVKVGPITAQYKGKATFIEKDEAGGKAVLRAEGRDTRGQGNANATVTATLVEDNGGTRVTVTTDLTVTGRVAQFGRGVMADVSSKLLGQFVECLETNVLGEAPAPPPPAPDAAKMAVGGSAGAAAPPAPPAPPSPSAAPASSSPAGGTSTGAAPAVAPAASAGGGVAVDTEAHTSPNGSGTAGASGSASDAGKASEPEQPTIRKIQSAPAQPVDLLDAAGGSVAKRAVPAIVAILLVLLFLRRRRRKG